MGRGEVHYEVCTMIVLPMAGLSSRFSKAGYDRPKYQLELDGYPVFDYALRSFVGRFGIEDFLIVMRSAFDNEAFVKARLAANGVAARLVVLDRDTAGQAETVALGLAAAQVGDAEPLTIFNIDSFRPGFSMTLDEYAKDGYVETFVGEGDGWSFVEPTEIRQASGLAKKLAEKHRISSLCCTGLYYFRERSIFDAAYFQELAEPSQLLTEHYIAPIYNQMIKRGLNVAYRVIPREQVIFCGVPVEYQELQDNPSLVRLLQPEGAADKKQHNGQLPTF